MPEASSEGANNLADQGDIEDIQRALTRPGLLGDEAQMGSQIADNARNDDVDQPARFDAHSRRTSND